MNLPKEITEATVANYLQAAEQAILDGNLQEATIFSNLAVAASNAVSAAVAVPGPGNRGRAHPRGR